VQFYFDVEDKDGKACSLSFGLKMYSTKSFRNEKKRYTRGKFASAVVVTSPPRYELYAVLSEDEQYNDWVLLNSEAASPVSEKHPLFAVVKDKEYNLSIYSQKDSPVLGVDMTRCVTQVEIGVEGLPSNVKVTNKANEDGDPSPDLSRSRNLESLIGRATTSHTPACSPLSSSVQISRPSTPKRQQNIKSDYPERNSVSKRHRSHCRGSSRASDDSNYPIDPPLNTPLDSEAGSSLWSFGSVPPSQSDCDNQAVQSNSLLIQIQALQQKHQQLQLMKLQYNLHNQLLGGAADSEGGEPTPRKL
jgi:hypothetical protein